MNKNLFLSLLALMMFTFNSIAGAADITKEFIAEVPEDIASCLIGMRVNQNIAYIMGSNGQYITIDLATSDKNSYKLPVNNILDYDVVVGKIIYIDSEGKLGGHMFPKWPKGPYSACMIEACDQGVIISGGANAYFLAKNATESIEIPEMNFCLPIEKGFMWSMQYNQENLWEADLYDCFGNLMSNVYKFSPDFKPTNLELGPNGVEGELLVSAVEKDVRTLSLIGNNGRMFWKINGPDKVCRRDVAFDKLEQLVVLEKNANGNIHLVRYKFVVPEG